MLLKPYSLSSAQVGVGVRFKVEYRTGYQEQFVAVYLKEAGVDTAQRQVVGAQCIMATHCSMDGTHWSRGTT